MSLTTLMVIAIIIVIFFTVVTLLAVNRGYAFEHTVDAKPTHNLQEEKEN
ncbi:MAG: YtzI protein [Lysinibacillus sp.]